MTSHQFVLTEDGSPSLETTYESGVRERMHHFRGALTESLYIYGAALELALDHVKGDLHLMSLGLGLGYNELIAAALFLRRQRVSGAQMVTFEVDEVLKSNFSAWLAQKSLADDWTKAFTQICDGIAKAYEVSPIELKSALTNWLQNGQWRLLSAFPGAVIQDMRFHVVFYDAFSRKMDGPLWDEDFLKRFLGEHTQQEAVLATYASTGNLKRALKMNGFTRSDRPGFAGKAESTLAFRFKAPLGAARAD